MGIDLMRRLSAYRVFLTERNEYHVREYVCCAVRNRRTGRFLEDHWALERPLADAFADAQGHMCSPSLPLIGEPLTFMVDGELFETTPVLAVEERDAIQLPLTASAALRAALAAGSASIRDTY
jgi:hypothetical protein